jgi:hypothetical protein
MRETCYRYKASVNPYRQSYFSEVVKGDKDEDGNHSCGYYWELDKRTKRHLDDFLYGKSEGTNEGTSEGIK